MAHEDLKAHLEFFGELGVDGVRLEPDWRVRPGAAAAPADAPAPAQPAQVFRSAAGAVAAIREDLGDCTRCKLHGLGRRQIVFGVGNPDADLMFVGEAPGADEDIQGEPFVGRAGQLLTKIIEAMKLTRDEVYICNVLKCRPPNNRTPEPGEVAQCEPYLQRQIEIVRPRIICCLGRVAAHALLRGSAPLSRLRGRLHEYAGTPVVVTYHPAALLRNAAYKRDTWEDVKWLRREYDGVAL